ncbi:hypothetical protein GDO81_002726 [Engystomops pustulosus]|uniref:Uncharacterized protein n=1 Tax=Engystomops pustulosus TaxID=76066 RepID=A0AAV7DMI3_ENGPU|nr:hypothetical protein GDO81_002726 [Engystomops pustulosus]
MSLFPGGEFLVTLYIGLVISWMDSDHILVFCVILLADAVKHASARTAGVCVCVCVYILVLLYYCMIISLLRGLITSPGINTACTLGMRSHIPFFRCSFDVQTWSGVKKEEEKQLLSLRCSHPL